MHDPLVVAFEIRRPWPKRSPRLSNRERWAIRLPFVTVAGRTLYFPGLITVWHVEPGGRDSGEVCRARDRRWHVRHWRIQVHPLQQLRRRLLTRCEWCGEKGSPNVSHQWDRAPGPWWRGEGGLFHAACSTVATAWRSCTCSTPELGGRDHGRCGRCDRFRRWGLEPWQARLYDGIRAEFPRAVRGDQDRIRGLAEMARGRA